MSQHIIIICIVSILLWYYYMKSKEQDDKYLPVMIRQSELMHENSKLKQENKKLKMRIKYLENYKNDVSKTFKILDNELGLINEHIKQTRPPQNSLNENISVPPNNSNVFRTSVTPSVLNTLLQTSQEPSVQSDNLFNNIFNRFLTGEMDFSNDHLASEQQQQQQTDDQHQESTISQDQELQETGEESPNMDQSSQASQASQASVSFSVNYLPLSSTYRQYLIRRDIPENNPSS